MHYICLDAHEMDNREQLHDYLAGKLAFPSYYGRNLDALYDCLGDIRQPTIIFINHQQALSDNLGNYGRKVGEVFKEAARRNKYIRLVVRY